MKRLFREPLVHFLLLGAALFAMYGLRGTRANGERGAIIVTQAQIASLASGFARTWQRPPTEQELSGLIRDHVRAEVYAREAKALGLDRDDVVINRRLQQKLEFVTEDVARQAEPTDADLQAYLQSHPERFRTEALVTFSQVYLNPERHRDGLARDLAAVRAQLIRAGNTAEAFTFADPTLLEPRFKGVDVSDVARQFGEPFASKLSTLQVGRWEGPIESGYGLHFVFVQERQPGRVPTLQHVRAAVAREWADAHRQQANDAFYRGLLERYSVTIDLPQMADEKLRDHLDLVAASSK
jgi:hypothetical protein